jgi:hypothetical protein
MAIRKALVISSSGGLAEVPAADTLDPGAGVAPATPIPGGGNPLVVKGGDANTIGNGGSLSLLGGDYAVGGSGGDVTVRGGSGSLNNGSIYLGDASTREVVLGPATLGTRVAGGFSVQGDTTLGDASADKITLTAQVAGNLTFDNAGNHDIVVAGVASGNGREIAVTGGAAAVAGIGGAAFVRGGAGVGSIGGDVYLRGGNGTPHGRVYVGDTTTSAVNIGAAGITTTIYGSISMPTSPLPIGSGGTGQTTASAAFAALAPSSPSDGDLIVYRGASTAWVRSTTLGGADTARFYAFNSIAPTTASAGDVILYDPSGTNGAGWYSNSGGALRLLAFNRLAPTTTKGDLIVYSSTNSRLGVSGNNGYCLQEDSTTVPGVKWSFLPVAGGGTGATLAADGFKNLAPVSATDGDLILYNSGGTVWVVASGTTAGRRNLAFGILSPLTTKGDLLVHTGAANVRQAVSATDGYRLSADSTQTNGVNYLDPMDGFYASPVSRLVSVTAVTAETTNTSRFLYLGRVKRAITSVQVRYRVTTLAATITWAEMGIFTSTTPPNYGSTASLSRVGFTDISGTITTTGLKSTTVNVSGVNVGDHLWVAWGCQATTLPVYRAALADDLQSGGFQTFAGRISTMAVPTTTALASNTLAPMWHFGKPS